MQFLLLLSLLSSLSLSLPLCLPSTLSQCTACCAMLFPSEFCSLDDVFRIKINGNGALGAIWDDSAVTVMVRDGCLLEMWDLRNQTGAHRTFGLDGLEVFPLDRYAFERRASSLRCTCQDYPRTTVTEDPLTTEH